MHEFIKHYFLPHSTNNHRAKILHNAFIGMLTIAILCVSSTSYFVKEEHPQVLGISYSISDSEMLTAVNQKRAENNLPPLTMNADLSQAAAGKAQHMFGNNYWAHFAPDGTTPWQFIRGANYDYVDAGENLAKGFTNSSDVVNAWMNSETHRANILSPKYKDIGFAVVPGTLQGEETVLVVQMFGSRGSSDVVVSDKPKIEVQTVPAESISLSTPSAVEKTEVVVTTTPEPIEIAQNPLVMSSNTNNKPSIDVGSYSKSMLLLIFITLLVVFVLDLIIIERRKVPRVVGHNIDHIMLITLFILFILLFKNGFVM